VPITMDNMETLRCYSKVTST